MRFPIKSEQKINQNVLNNSKDVPNTQSKQDVSRFRRFALQFIAATSANWVMFGAGIVSFFPGIILPALVGIRNEHNLDEPLSISPHESSWLGSIGTASAVIGGISSAFITDLIGRKRTMLLSNVSLLPAWFMLYRATSVWEIFTANAMLGLGSGLVDVPVIAYVGEIGEAEFRSVLMAYAFISFPLGSLFVSILNTWMAWRMAAMVCILVPIASIALCLLVPESPIWLLSKNRPADALKALQWLRGCKSNATTADEFRSLQRYDERIKSCVLCVKQQAACPHPPPTLFEKLVQLKRKQYLKPLAIVLTLLVIMQISRFVVIQPYIVQIFSAYKVPMKPDEAAKILNSINILAYFMFLSVIHFIGKRRLYLIVLSIISLCTLTMAVYGFTVLPSHFNSFCVQMTYELYDDRLAYIPFVCILTVSFCTYMGISAIPSQMMSELLTSRVRGIVTGLMATFSSILKFVLTQEYEKLEATLSLPGVTLSISILLGIGLFTMYMILPETRQRSLEDIELHYSDNSKKITNHKISKSQKSISVIRIEV